ncbi:MAG: hypothetical protein KGL31_09220 [candidate division NC10 bacterium]|nr:hypothetical protein [candidate division NC10 bacterium]MDE2322078.1 hypothetical protein [candidate division NC10 bacterium]
MDPRVKLARKLRRNPAGILKEDEVQVLVTEARRLFGAELEERLGVGTPRFEDHVRWRAVEARCCQARAEKGMDTRSAATAAKIPRYRVEAVEQGRLSDLRPDLAWRYFTFLGIDRWVRRWARANSTLAERAGITPAGSASAAVRRGCKAGNLTTRRNGLVR